MDKKELLEVLINHYSDGNKARFAGKIGVRPQTINTWLMRHTFDVELIFSKCEGISGDWLLSGGDGEMLRCASIISADNGGIAAGGDIHGSTTMGAGSTINYSDCVEDKHSQIVSTLTESVATLTRELETSQDQKTQLIKIIDKLTDK